MSRDEQVGVEGRSSLLVEVASGELVHARTDLVLVPVFEPERPLRGDAGRADWRLCGTLSQLLVAGDFSGRAGEAVLVPTRGRLRAPRLLALGWGEKSRLDVGGLRDLTHEGVARALALRAASIAVSLPLGAKRAVAAEQAAPAVVEGAVQALEESAASFRLRVLVPESRRSAAADAVEAALPDLAASLAIDVRRAGVGDDETTAPGVALLQTATRETI